jgi:hypothetical protein
MSVSITTCVFRSHHTPEHDREGCPLVRTLIRRIDALEMSGAPGDIERELDKYRAVARVLECPLVPKLAAQDLRALVAARQISWRSDWARQPVRLPALA